MHFFQAPAHALLAALVAVVLAILAGCTSKPDSAAPAASAASSPQRSLVKNEFVAAFAKECLPRIPANSPLTPAQQTAFCQCFAERLADNNSETQLLRYIARQDLDKLKADADSHGKACLAQVRNP